ncbi:uncharacterized protein N7518_009508 [Penicillium psychrosexuale]|uniref:uncharacterized protein n=1 Tax=Penicillium psychrosexuale TaxID=1002107 RepID=UPI0025450394|nr:uncharacterized protein N7518_009508 [Penicillium psychrosexuale]KAJ5783831.1 hypothetical protein N7518_009508 [Penicillium psychrosexuale]
MHILPKLAITALLLISPATCLSSPKPPGKDAILLSNVQTLTLRAHRMTTARRVSPIPQLSCAGPSKQTCNLYQPETMRCTNQGYDYDVEDVQWTCTADMPAEFKLGATDVICEGYRNADDKWVLKGSCGVEYRLLLTEAGEKRFGKRNVDSEWGGSQSGTGIQKIMEMLGNLIFFGFIAAVFILIFLPILAQCFGWGNRRGGRAGQPPGWGGFWGGGGGGPGGNDPPPPYSSFDPYKSSARQGWTPGFWTGALGGGAAGYQMGRRAYSGSRGRSDGYDPGEGSSRSPQFSSTTASTGFGSTRRR